MSETSSKTTKEKKNQENVPTLRETIQATVNEYLKEKVGDKATIDVSVVRAVSE